MQKVTNETYGRLNMYYLKCFKCGKYFSSEEIGACVCPECELLDDEEDFDSLPTIQGHDNNEEEELHGIDEDVPEVIDAEEEIDYGIEIDGSIE